MPPVQPCTARGLKRYTLNRQTTTLTLPEELERLRAERRRGAAIVADLEILEQAAAAAPEALEVAWRPPTKNRERITGYKVP